MGERNSEERRYIISRWTKKFEQEKEDEKKRREKAEAQINLLLLEQKLKEKFNTANKEQAENKWLIQINDFNIWKYMTLILW